MRPEILWGIIGLHVWRYIYADHLVAVSQAGQVAKLGAYLAVLIGVSDFDSPRCSSISQIQHCLWVGQRREHKTIVKDNTEDLMLRFKAVRFLLSTISMTSRYVRLSCLSTSSTGMKCIEWSIEYFWKSRPWIVSICSYSLSSTVVPASGSLFFAHF